MLCRKQLSSDAAVHPGTRCRKGVEMSSYTTLL